MPTLQLAGGRTFHVADSLLAQPADHVRRYHAALAPETAEEEAVEEHMQRAVPQPAPSDMLGQMAQQARLAVFAASPKARALTILVEQVEQQPAGDLSDQGLRDRLSYLLACGLTETQVQEQHDRIAAELRALTAPLLATYPDAEARAIAEAQAQQRRIIALCDVMLGVEAPELTTRTQLTDALLDLLEPAGLVLGAHSSIHPLLRQRALDSLCLLLLREQYAGRLTLLPTPWQKKPNIYLLPLGLFLEHVRATSARLPA
ncbi:hypothetical protein GCM10023172_23140 [Hymenobacter ginsengisoli]|uniref:Uncharacterized protein n=1 Tax=Hymenobacter ginsengisoli TaxID=1051626 RepID=A0ABP8QDB5_9BACT|nr:MULTISPECIES: hypothetical protein [unclassified Hymenobacter]MBO2031922.1 hypothetical protein [Hymenobacter sp. BT559]